MKGGLLAAWVVGEGIVIWRLVHRDKKLPPPGLLLGITALFAGLALVAEYEPAAGFATAVGWGLDVAALFNVLPQGLAGQVSKAQAAEARTQGAGVGTPARTV